MSFSAKCLILKVIQTNQVLLLFFLIYCFSTIFILFLFICYFVFITLLFSVIILLQGFPPLPFIAKGYLHHFCYCGLYLAFFQVAS